MMARRRAEYALRGRRRTRRARSETRASDSSVQKLMVNRREVRESDRNGRGGAIGVCDDLARSLATPV